MNNGFAMRCNQHTRLYKCIILNPSKPSITNQGQCPLRNFHQILIILHDIKRFIIRLYCNNDLFGSSVCVFFRFVLLVTQQNATKYSTLIIIVIWSVNEKKNQLTRDWFSSTFLIPVASICAFAYTSIGYVQNNNAAGLCFFRLHIHTN